MPQGRVAPAQRPCCYALMGSSTALAVRLWHRAHPPAAGRPGYTVRAGGGRRPPGRHRHHPPRTPRNTAGRGAACSPAQCPAIYWGRLPPMLYAIGTLEVQVDRQGNVGGSELDACPAPCARVVAEIETHRADRGAYPVPSRLGRVTYTDTWLWDKAGAFSSTP